MAALPVAANTTRVVGVGVVLDAEKVVFAVGVEIGGGEGDRVVLTRVAQDLEGVGGS